MNMNDISELINSNGLSFFEKDLLAVLKPSIRILNKETCEENITVGASKFGGRPDLPKGISWPNFSINKPYSFIGQINLGDLQLPTNGVLPEYGIIYFFLATENLFSMTEDIYNEQNAKVFYEKEVAELERVDFPLNLSPDLIYKACELEYNNEFNIPPAEYSVLKDIGISLEAQESFVRYCNFHRDFLGKYNIVDNFFNKLLGYPNQIQGDLQLQCDEKFPLDWVLLLQVDSDYEKTNMMWGDCGRLYFMIKQQDLIDGRFQNCFVIYQS